MVWSRHLFVRIVAIVGIMVLGATLLPYKAGAAALMRGNVLTLRGLPTATAAARTPIYHFDWGSANGQIGAFTSGEGGVEGPMSFAIANDGRLAILDQVNSRVQIFDTNGQWQQSITVPRTASHLLFMAQGVVVSEPWYKREVLAYDPNGVLRERVALSNEVEWPTDLAAIGSSIYVESDGRLLALPFTTLPMVSANAASLPGRPLLHQAGMSMAPGRLEANSQAVRLVNQGNGRISQLQLHIADRQILQLQDYFSDPAGNLYIQLYLSESLTSAEYPERNPEALLKIDARGMFVGAFIQSSMHYTLLQQRQYVLGPDGAIYQMQATAEGVTIYRLSFPAVGQARSTRQSFTDLPAGLFAPPASRPNVAPPPTRQDKVTTLVDHAAPESGDVSINGFGSGSYSGPPPMTVAQIMEIAQSAVGSPYRFGGESWNPFNRSYNGADCSGLVSTAWQVNHARPSTEEASSRPSTTDLLNIPSGSAWYSVSNRQAGDAFTSSSHAFLYEAEGSSGQVWVYEALNQNYPIRHAQRSFSGYSLRRRSNLDAYGIAGRDKGWIFGEFLDVYQAFGGQGAVGYPFDNGGSYLVHRWDVNGEDGFTQDFRGGSRGQTAIMHGDARPGSFLVQGAIYWTYMNMGGPGSWLGWPTSNEESFWNGCKWTVRQRYVGGYITEDCNSGIWRAFGY